jgi:hypothetical protein
MDTYQTLFSKYQYDTNMRYRSQAWFQQQVLLLGKERITPNKLVNNSASQNKPGIIPGNLYLYAYDPKYKKTLPYYDRFPLVFPFRKTPNGFIGLNMHYLAYPLRVKLLDRLQQFRNNDKMDGTTKLKLTWATIDGVSRFSLAKPCVKEYLLDHVRSQFVKINSKDWGTAMLLPVERFVGSTKDQVWRDSLGRI